MHSARPLPLTTALTCAVFALALWTPTNSHGQAGAKKAAAAKKTAPKKAATARKPAPMKAEVAAPAKAAPIADPGTAIAAAIVDRKAGRFDRAFATLKSVVEADARNARGHHELATLYAIHGQFTEAARHFQIALSVDANLVAARRNLAEVLRADGRHADALGHYRKLEHDIDGRVSALRGIALCEEALGRPDAARAPLRTLSTDYKETEAGRWAAGHLVYLDQQRASGDVSPAVADQQGKRLFDEGRHAEAVSWFGYAMNVAPNADRAFRLGVARMAARDHLGAVAALQHALRLDRGHKAAMSAYPTALRKLRSVGVGGQDVALTSTVGGTPGARAAAALLRGDLLLAEQIAKAGNKGRYKGITLLLIAAEAALRAGRLHQADKNLRAVLKRQPRHPTAIAAMAETSYRRGRHTDARRLAGLAHPPRDPSARGLPVADLEQYVRWRRDYVDRQLAMAVDPLRKPPMPFQLVEGIDPESRLPAKKAASPKP